MLDITRDSFPSRRSARSSVASPATSSTDAAWCSYAACPSIATARNGRRRSTGASGCTSAGPGRRTPKGHLLGDVTDQGRAASDPTSRGNEIGGIAFPFHSDGSDLVGLFCLDAGASGGASLVANAVTIHNELVRSDPELAAELYAPFPYDLRGEQAPGTKPWYTMPIFNRCGDRLFVRYIRPYIESTRRHDDAPRPSDAAREAMDRVDAMCADPQFHVSMTMQPGDMQFVNNYHVLHATRTKTIARPDASVTSSVCGWRPTSSPTVRSRNGSGSVAPTTGGRARDARRASSTSELRLTAPCTKTPVFGLGG